MTHVHTLQVLLTRGPLQVGEEGSSLWLLGERRVNISEQDIFSYMATTDHSDVYKQESS